VVAAVPGSACRILTATEGGTGAPEFFLTTPILAPNSGGKEGGVVRTMVDRLRMASRGRWIRAALVLDAA
jgi:hypothetical protein